MWRKLFVMLLGLSFFLLSADSAAAQEKSYSADRFDVAVVVQEDGSLLVKETVVFNFVGEPFTYVFRELPTNLTDGITILSASVDGRTYPSGSSAGQVEIEEGRDILVTWHFEPTANASRTFVLEYQMFGVVRQADGADLLRYQPLPDEFEYSIDASTVTITYPDTAVLQGPPTVTAGNALLASSGNPVTFNWENIGPDDTLVVELPFEPGSLIRQPPAWQARRAEQNALAPLWLSLSGLIIGLGAVGTFLIWRQDQPLQRQKSLSSFEPPSKLPPALAGVLNGTGVKPSWSNALAALFDLADRGILSIEEREDKKWYRAHDFNIVLRQEPKDLRPHEQGLLDLLFDTKDGRKTAVQLSKLSGAVSGKQWKKFSEPLEAEIKAAGYVDQGRKTRRQRIIIGSLAVLILSLISFVALPAILIDLFGAWPATIGVSLLVVFIMLISVGSSLTILTDEAKLMADEWQSFYKYLKDVTRKKAAVGGTEMFSRFLPYAASYGLVHQWARFFQKEGWTKLPPYFQAVSRTGEESMAAFVAMTASTSTSGGSAAGAGGAGAGAAGGGGSGAG